MIEQAILCPSSPFDVVALVGSAGGIEVIRRILSGLPRDFPSAVVVMTHRRAPGPAALVEVLRRCSPLPVTEADSGSMPQPGTVVVVPGGQTMTFAHDSRYELNPSARPFWTADELLASAALRFGHRALAVVVTGGNADGGHGSAVLRAAGGTVIAQEAARAVAPQMPRAAARSADYVLAVEAIAPALVVLARLPDGVAPVARMVPEHVATAEMRGPSAMQLAIRARVDGHRSELLEVCQLKLSLRLPAAAVLDLTSVLDALVDALCDDLEALDAIS